MSKKSYLFTSESVSEGHPDKVCDRISDMVVDTYLAKEPLSRVACETLTTTNKVVLAGETRGPEIKKKDQFPDLLINISEDAWFGQSIGPYQHFTKAIYRSIEEGVFIARSANKGISAFIDPNGRVIKSLNTGESGNIELNFPNFYQPTLFSIYENKIFFLIILLYILLTLILKKFKI